MNNLLDVPITSITELTPERAVVVTRAILRSECGYSKLGPDVLTISCRLTTSDGGIDAEINVPPEVAVPGDCIFKSGLTGFQIKSGTTFKPWTISAIRSELLDSNGQLYSEVERLVQRGGRYTLICTGHDLIPKQRNQSRRQIATVFAEKGFTGYEDLVDVLGASQVAEFAERYPGTASLLTIDQIQEAWVLEEWQRDSHMANPFETSSEQDQLISRIRMGLQGEVKHFRILGEPGLGKTRIVLESVKDESLAPYVLYIPHGSLFGQTRLFRQLLKGRGYSRPLVLVIDELPESELADIWRHLKPLCGSLKIVSLDHGRDETHDEEIVRLNIPRLPDETIKNILVRRVGDLREIDRWVAICEGSPRVAQAVADNLRANPDDLLKPPATIPIWKRFLHGYGSRDEGSARQVDCVAQHLALFNRFGYETPVGNEAEYIAELIRKVDPTIGWARFQEIVQNLRARRVLQGSRTLFFVPKALHIYLWRQFWECYGRGFDFTQTFSEMPESLHSWFMRMFIYAGDAATAHVIDEILKPDGIFFERIVITSKKGSQFLSILAEANPSAVLRLLEGTIGRWTDEELLALKESRQNFVWTLEKIAVWSKFTIRAIQVLGRLAANENSNFSNNSTGTLIGLFRIGPEAAATESSPEARLPAMLKLLRSPSDTERLLGLKAMSAALETRGIGYRIVGPEYQGLKERAKLWMPATYGEWWQAKLLYFQVLLDETREWSPVLQAEVCETLLEAVDQLLTIPPCTDLAFQVLQMLVDESAMPPGKLNKFFWHWQEYKNDGNHPEIIKKLRRLERYYTRRDLASRFQRYVIDVDWLEWDEGFRERHNKTKSRAKILVTLLAQRIAKNPENLDKIKHLLASPTSSPALWYFGEQMAQNDITRALLSPLIQLTLETRHEVCLRGYLSAVLTSSPDLFFTTVRDLLGIESTAWLGVSITLQSNYDDDLFVQCLNALEESWVDPQLFSVLRYGKTIESVPSERLGRLLRQLNKRDGQGPLFFLIKLLDLIPFNDSSPFDSDFVFGVVSRCIPDEEHSEGMRGYYWKNVCEKLIKWDPSRAIPLLDALLTEMGRTYRLSYDSDVVLLTNEIVQANPTEVWKIIKTHFEEALPKWRGELFGWLRGGSFGFDEEEPRGAIAELPVPEILKWIEEDPASRAALMAHAVPGTLDKDKGGQLTRELLYKYGHLDGVQSGISATFHSGGWTGPASAYLKRKREKLRVWLSSGFEIEVVQWVENEIEYLDRRIEREEISEERSRFD